MKKCSKQKVLIVEDSGVVLGLMRKYFEQLGIPCDIADDGEKAVSLCSQNCYSLILMDINMPHMDGFEASGLIRAKEKGKEHVPIVAITSHEDYTTYRYKQAGMDGLVVKPVNFNQVELVLSEFVGDYVPLDVEGMETRLLLGEEDMHKLIKFH